MVRCVLYVVDSVICGVIVFYVVNYILGAVGDIQHLVGSVLDVVGGVLYVLGGVLYALSSALYVTLYTLLYA